MALFSKLRGSSRVPPVKSNEAPSEGPLDVTAVLDALGGVLRALGRYTFALESNDAASQTQRFDAWAQHLMVLGPHPDRPEKADDDGDGTRRRDWGGLQGFISEQRRREQSYVQGTIGALRDAVWNLAHSANRIIVSDRDADNDIGKQIEKLRSAADTKPIAELRQEVQIVARNIEHIAEEKRRLQAEDADAVGRHIQTLHEQLSQAKNDAALDGLTRLHNRRSFDDYASRISVIEKMSHLPTAMLIVDVDHFKKINDTFGHAIGDEVLRALADALSRSFPGKDDFIARYGGEEFVVILPDMPLEAARQKAERLRSLVTEVVAERLPALHRVTVSVGVADRGQREPVKEWLVRADAAMYQAKSTGRNKVVVGKAPASH